MINMKKVAKKANVSISTVSRVFSNKKYYIKESTREKVLAAAKELGYFPNGFTAGIHGAATHNIALFVPSISNEMFPPIIKGAEDFLRKKGYNIILCIINDDLEIEKYYVNKLRNGIVDGFIICSMLSKSDSIRKLIKEEFPVVLVARYYNDNCNAVIIDNFQASYDAVNYLLRTGKKRIAVVLGPKELNVYGQRLEGYKEAIKNAGIEFDEKLIINETSGDNGLYQGITELLKRDSQIDAIFATNDHKAIITMKAIHDLGLKIPDDISVLGFDNIKVSTMLNPPLSTVSQPFYEMGKLAATKIYNIINGQGPKEPVVDVLNTEIIIRKTTI
ncbi:MAG TPA: LacI family DNA-binding transcriptional regulator [Sedimentibacter sp.]|jgi:LacI family transcriptional regulator|nr:LacI family DNA-binding transcriptional regulator [Sedimentibacter sp.]